MMKRLAPLWMVPLIACGTGTDGSDAPTLAVGQGRLALEIAAESDARGAGSGGKPAQVLAGLAEIIVDIDEVTAHSSEAGWVVLLREPRTVDILRLADSAVELGFADLPAGRINQIRLHVAEDSSPYVTRQDGSTAPLKVPSGKQSGIKLKGTWDLAACQVTRVQARFDRRNSIHVVRTGQGEQHILRPVIFAGGASYEDAFCGEAPPSDGSTPPGDGTTPPGDGTTPPGDGTTPPGDGLDPGSESPDPGSEGSTPPGSESPSGDDPATSGGDDGSPGGQSGDGSGTPTGSAGGDSGAPGGSGGSSPDDGLCDSGQACGTGFTCGYTGVCIPEF